ncbi:hypothetical protein PR202_ga13532 [Eleusine coracana subsp. coracana]|uniref:Glycosyltransferase n=1 Tax=Eleusine coracana subsp. coracana TaxID=191504 RepID=A0AAV5CEZ7_ELECO|nr:hypothetical protein PR202_ga13532 [Eleusine coracana subsp. coracana]
MAPPHVLVLPFPAQGHVIPMIELSHYLADHGVKVTFVNTELNHRLILGALATTGDTNLGGVNMVSIPDGLGDSASRTDLGRLTDSFSKVMPGELEKLILRMGAGGDEEGISWLIADVNMAWSFPVATRLGVRAAGFCPSSATMFATRIRIPELIRDGVIDEDGRPRRPGAFRLAPGVAPVMDAAEISWNRAGDPAGQPFIFQLILRNNAATHLAETIVCNSVQELEPGTFALFPGRVVPVGPLSSDKPVIGSFWAQDATCATWLDARPANSVVYVAFGSAGQAHELLLDRIRRLAGPRGCVVSWCPQRRVLAHPSVACFVTHCGWNSTVEAVASGVPMLCWPYFADQFLNQRYICDVWRTGVQVVVAGSGTGRVERDAVRAKVEELIGDEELKERARALRDVARRAVGDGGSSRRNLKRFVDLVRGSAS